ncbi:DUF4160 domain-containing protein [Azospirillum sp. SYSU D00513]|uniref:DUF4160 domain-containing protein n=1 Tax=Azospirillum sp. SYSU D00513 TaxID=2812561 RepID=UPI001A976D5F|nr:DUF4160 domain-containing protein [Azospirillum sp. SYSU D00513]
MGKLLRRTNWYLEVRGREHYPAHFHVVGPDFAALVDMKTLAVIEGGMPRVIGKEALEWAAANGERLVAEWNRMNPDLPFRP